MKNMIKNNYISIKKIVMAVVMLQFILFAFACKGSDNPAASEEFENPTPILSKLSNTADGVLIEWDSDVEGMNYRVFKKEADSSEWQILGDTTENNYTDSTVNAGVTYSYTIRCLDESGNKYTSGYDETGKTITFNYFESPKMDSARQNYNQVEISWNAVSGAAQYRVFRKSGDKWDKIGDTAETNFVDEKPENGTTYYYTVRCLNVDGSSYESDFDHKGLKVVFKILDTPVISEAHKSDNGIEIIWSGVSDAEQYRVYRKNDEGKWDKVADTTATACVDSNVESGNTYVYTVRCITKDGKSYMSDFDKKGIEISY